MSTDYKTYSNQQHLFYSFERKADYLDQLYVNVNQLPSFPVKEIKFDFAYSFTSNNVAQILVTADLANSELVGSLTNFSYVYNDGKDDLQVYSDGFKASKCISFIPKDPIKIPGMIAFNFQNLIGTTTLSGSFVCTIHIEFLGY